VSLPNKIQNDHLIVFTVYKKCVKVEALKLLLLIESRDDYMPSELYKVEVTLPIQSIWRFISVMDNWAPLVPGYLEHEIINDKESTWKFKSDLGVIKKKIHLKVDITSWIEPTKVTFNLTGINEKMTGQGYFEAQKINENNTLMSGYLEITPEGKMAKMINSKLKKNLVDMTEELTKAIISKVEEVEGANRV
jgi:carbon monoxide dehydrogenase subunit G